VIWWGRWDLDGNRVRGPGGNRIFRRLPNTITAAELKLLLTALSELFGEFLEQIFSAHEGVAHDARPDIASNDQLHGAIADQIAVGPALPGDLLHFDGGTGCRGEQSDGQQQSRTLKHCQFHAALARTCGG
jgi:hypothetical protein